MVGRETPGSEVQIVWVASPVGLGLRWARGGEDDGAPHGAQRGSATSAHFLRMDLQNPTV